MQQAKRGDTVSVHYKGTLDDGTVFDSSEDGEPISFTIGSGQVIPGFETAVDGMSVGDAKTEKIESENAYGPRRDELVFRVGREQLPDGEEVEVGDVLRLGFPDGTSAAVQVADMDDASLTLDANHPLAGKDLTFELKLVSIG
jgi:FKBP-type peptidyl-prolyl cis-trans isomerase 2